MPYDPLPDLAGMSLAEIGAAVEARRLPPIETWNPAETADSHMRIAADGTWFHEGRPITRPAMVRAFASLLTRDTGGQHWLVTPECRQSIEVEDAAFQAVEVRAEGDALAFRLNTDELVLAGPDHDPGYFTSEIAPRLGPDTTWVGHLDAPGCAALVVSQRWYLAGSNWLSVWNSGALWNCGSGVWRSALDLVVGTRPTSTFFATGATPSFTGTVVNG